MADTLIEQNTEELEEVLQMALNLPEGSVSGGGSLDPELKLLVLGDSIFGLDVPKKWLKTFGCDVQNYAVSGATFAKISERKYPDGTYNYIGDQLYRFKNKLAPLNLAEGEEWSATFDEPDVILIDGGNNDYIYSAVMGTSGGYPHIFKEPSYDETTVLGAMETVFRDLCKSYPKAQKLFVVMHRVYQSGPETLTGYKRKYWPARACYFRIPYTREEGGKSVTTWEVAYEYTTAKEYFEIESESQAINANKIRVRKYNESKTTDEGYIGFSDAGVDMKSSIVVNGKVDFTNVKANYNYDTLRENVIKHCNMYGFKVIDLYNESPLNYAPPYEIEIQPYYNTTTGVTWWAYYHPYEMKWRGLKLKHTNKNGANEEIHKTIRNNNYKLEVANLELLDWQYIHPTLKGYEIGYEPYIKQALSLGTKK